VVEDFVNLMDLAPTFMEVAAAKAPEGMHGRSLLPVLRSDKSGQIDPARSFVVSGRERHVGSAREGNLPYPHRALRTGDFLYIKNFTPDRWPMGAPPPEGATSGQLTNDTRAGFADMDAGPTKAWLIAHRDDPAWKWHYDYAFAKRPEEELYDLRKDPEQMQSVATDPAYAEAKAKLAAQLMDVLKNAGDPRVTGDGGAFDRPPFSDPETKPARPRGRSPN
jgi:uncharacterized sulfatase